MYIIVSRSFGNLNFYISYNQGRNMKEKRKFPRVAKEVKTEVHSTDGMTFSTSRDLSYGGIFISTSETLKIGSEVQLSIISPDEENIEIKGKVKWMSDDNTKDNKCGMGIEFIGKAEDLNTKIKKIMDLKGLL